MSLHSALTQALSASVGWARRRVRSLVGYQDRWHLARPDQCITYLTSRTQYLARRANCGRVLIVAEQPSATHPVAKSLAAKGIDVVLMTTADVAGGTGITGPLAAAVCVDLDSRRVATAARACMAHGALAHVAFEYAIASDWDYASLLRHDNPRYSKSYFHGPHLTHRVNPFTLYERSLAHFDLKCDIRDYLDLFQCLDEITRLGIEGAVAEFGSYQGHSGWLIAQTLKALGDDRRSVYLFDAFESFPSEVLGIDQFWSETCVVDFDEVKAKFTDLPTVQLVKGEFAQTLPTTPGTFAMVHIDCDSHRGIRYVAGQVYDRVAPGGLLVFEDYGHPALLGARLAVDEFLDRHPECGRFYSQFSGVFVARKPR